MYFPVFVCNISIYQQTCLNLVNVGRNHVSFRNSGQILEAVKTLKTFKKNKYFGLFHKAFQRSNITFKGYTEECLS